jgi:hypothetical protein
MNTEQRLCKDCKHYRLQHDTDRCSKRVTITIDLVRGETVKSSPSYCDLERQHLWWSARLNNVCGAEGRWWEAK